MASKARPGAEKTAAASQPDESLLALDNELSRNVLELELMRLRHVDLSEDQFEHDVETRRARISQLYDAIADSKPKTLAGAAVLLRRVPAMLADDHDVDHSDLSLASQLIDTALAVVEKNAS